MIKSFSSIPTLERNILTSKDTKLKTFIDNPVLITSSYLVSGPILKLICMLLLPVEEVTLIRTFLF